MKIKTICDDNGNKHGTFKYILVLDILITIIACISIFIIKRLRNNNLVFKTYMKWTYYDEFFKCINPGSRLADYKFRNNVKLQLPSNFFRKFKFTDELISDI